MGSTLIRGATIVTLGRQGTLSQGDLLVEGECIADIAPKIDAPADEVVQANGCILIPGLVNAHMHTWQTALRG
ncbi:MAG: amidohydrolase, partial [Pseudomonadales bacterium]